MAWMLQGAMVGVSRRLLESSAPESQIDSLRAELIFFAGAYLEACTTRPRVQHAVASKQGPKREPRTRGRSRDAQPEHTEPVDCGNCAC